MKTQPLALKASIPTTESAIKISGGKGEACRLTLDVYGESEDLPKLLDLRGKRLYVVFTEEQDNPSLPSIELPPIAPINLEGS